MFYTSESSKKSNKQAPHWMTHFEYNHQRPYTEVAMKIGPLKASKITMEVRVPLGT